MYSVFLEWLMTKIAQFVMSKITHNLLCKKCRKSRYFYGRILTRISLIKYSMSACPPAKISIDMEFLYLVGLGGKSFSCQTKEQLWLSLYCGWVGDVTLCNKINNYRFSFPKYPSMFPNTILIKFFLLCTMISLLRV